MTCKNIFYKKKKKKKDEQKVTTAKQDKTKQKTKKQKQDWWTICNSLPVIFQEWEALPVIKKKSDFDRLQTIIINWIAFQVCQP